MGTTTRMRFPHWNNPRTPRLGDIAYQASGPGTEDEDLVRRAYSVEGIEETADGRGFVLVMERVEFGTLPHPTDERAEAWSFHNTPRGER